MGINDIDSENDRRNHLLRISSIGIHRHVFMADGIHRHVIFRMADLIFHTYQVVSRIIETTFLALYMIAITLDFIISLTRLHAVVDYGGKLCDVRNKGK